MALDLPENDPALKTWVNVPHGSDFPIQNLPFGAFRKGSGKPELGVALGDYVIALKPLAEWGYFDGLPLDAKAVLGAENLNPLLAHPKATWRALRARISELFRADNERLKNRYEHREKVLVHKADVEMQMPFEVGDYTDFYSSEEHAVNVGSLFRPDNPLLPNWKHLPVGYHGRASSIVLSGTPVHRPKGQQKPQEEGGLPSFGDCQMLDFELEVAFVCGQANVLGQRLSVDKAEDHIFGLLLFNDWSARDIQAWEYQPLGPFLSKNFASSISPWVVTLDALEPFRTHGPKQDPAPLPYLRGEGEHHFDIKLSVDLKARHVQRRLCESNHKLLYWSMAQQLAHHTVTGCNIGAGDLCASGTISGEGKGAMGSLLEITRRGQEPVGLGSGLQRTFLEDGDEVILKGHCEKDGLRIGFGECRGKVLPSVPL